MWFERVWVNRLIFTFIAATVIYIFTLLTARLVSIKGAFVAIMLYVFSVDTGEMYSFEMELAMER